MAGNSKTLKQQNENASEKTLEKRKAVFDF